MNKEQAKWNKILDDEGLGMNQGNVEKLPSLSKEEYAKCVIARRNTRKKKKKRRMW